MFFCLGWCRSNCNFVGRRWAILFGSRLWLWQRSTVSKVYQRGSQKQLTCFPVVMSYYHAARVNSLQYCPFVCLSVNKITPEPLEISSRNFQGIILQYLTVERLDKFENSYWEMRGWWKTSLMFCFVFIILAVGQRKVLPVHLFEVLCRL